VAAFAFRRPVINLPLEDEGIRELSCSVEKSKVLKIEFDVSAFHEGWSGSITLRFSTPNARRFVALMNPPVEDVAD
jgi:hypothetical protein